MPPARYDAAIEQGTTFRRIVEYRQPGGDQYDLTGWRAELVVRRARPPREVVATIETGADEAIVLDETTGQITVTLTAEFTSILPPSRYVYILDLISPSDEVVRVLRGTIIVRRR